MKRYIWETPPWSIAYTVVAAFVLLLVVSPVMAVDNTLAALELNVGKLAQPFSANATMYFALVPEAERAVAITPVANDPAAVIRVSMNGEPAMAVRSGASSPELELEIGTNMIVVTVGEGPQAQVYRVMVPKRTVRFQQGAGGYEGAADTQLVQAVKYVEHNLGAQHKIEVGYSGPWARDQKYVLLRFEDVDIPAQATVTEANVNLWYFGDRVSHGESISVLEKEVYMHRIRIPWVEGTGGSATSHDGDLAKEGEAAWDTFMAQAAPFHFNVLDTVLVGQETGWYSWDATDLVTDWLTGAVPNYGVLLKTYEYPSNGDPRMVGTKQFRSREHADVSERPFLGVVYTMPLQSIAADVTEVYLETGASTTVTALPRPLNAVYDTIQWSTDNASVATVDNGEITAVGAGEATVQAVVTADDVTYSVAVNVFVN